MAAPDQLSQEFETLTDEELIERLRSEDLTQIASDTARRELAKRGVDVDRALVESPSVPVQLAVSATTLQRVRRAIGILTRILRFPWRAVLGVEPPWIVVLFGAALLYLWFRLIVYGLTETLLLHPRRPHALPIAYAAAGLMALGMVWYALAIWRSAKRVKSRFWRISVRVLATLVALNTVFATLNLIGVMQQHFTPEPASVMDSLPTR